MSHPQILWQGPNTKLINVAPQPCPRRPAAVCDAIAHDARVSNAFARPIFQALVQIY